MKIVLVGDSIRMGYQPFVQEKVGDRAEVWGPAENCRHSLVHRETLTAWAIETKPDVYHFNCGIHDLVFPDAGQRFTVSGYVRNLKLIVKRLKADGLLDRVLVVTFSEFGRRVQENAGGGTDHGEAAPMFLIGSKLHPGIHEKHPSLATLHRGALIPGCDFRRVYATVLRDWLNIKPDKVLDAGFAPLRLIKK